MKIVRESRGGPAAAVSAITDCLRNCAPPDVHQLRVPVVPHPAMWLSMTDNSRHDNMMITMLLMLLLLVVMMMMMIRSFIYCQTLDVDLHI